MAKKLAQHFGVCLLACVPAITQMNGDRTVSPGQSTASEHRTTVTGCLSAPGDQYVITSVDNGTSYVLTGDTAGVENQENKLISVEGLVHNSIPAHPSLEVIEAHVVFDTPKPILSLSFSNPPDWRKEAIQEYGVRFAHPVDGSVYGSDERLVLEPYFERSRLEQQMDTYQNAIAVGGFRIPEQAFGKTLFQGGSFVILVNPTIKSQASCNKFDSGEAPDFYKFGTISYASTDSSGAAMGHGYSEYYFHTLQNGMCYELAFGFETVASNPDEPWCKFTRVGEDDFLKVIKPVMEHVSFFRPKPGVR